MYCTRRFTTQEVRDRTFHHLREGEAALNPYLSAFDAWYLPFSSSGAVRHRLSLPYISKLLRSRPTDGLLSPQFDNQGQHYNVTKILTGGEAVRFDEECVQHLLFLYPYYSDSAR